MELLIKFVNNHPQLKQLKISIYLDINKCGWFGTNPFYYKFIPLFESARRHYINENVCSGEILRMGTQEIKDFCQHYVNEYESTKKDLNVLVD